MKLIFLGTSDAIPTEERNHPSLLLSYKNENILIDCGEGTQRQLRKAGISPTKITRLLITHWHGDHVLGIPGLLQTLGFSEYSQTLQVYGPPKTKEFFKQVLSSFRSIYTDRVKLKINEIKAGKIIENKDFAIYAEKLEHYNCYGYRFEEKDRRKINLSYIKKVGIKPGPILKQLQLGRDIAWQGKRIKASEATFLVKGKAVAFIFDTGYCNAAVKLAKNADVVVSEATYLEEHKNLADARFHLTAKQAASIAKQAGAKRLYLIHISRRYQGKENLILKEAKKLFPATELARDLLAIEI